MEALATVFDSGQKFYQVCLITIILYYFTPRASLVAQMVKNLLAMQETWVLSLGREDPLEEGIATLSSMLA